MIELAEQCPWDGFDPATISFCEERLCGWVAEPCNSVTSLTKTVVGIFVLRDCWRTGLDSLAFIGLVALYMGFGGFALHATGTFWGEALDVGGMFMLSGLFVTFNLRRLRGSGSRQLLAFYGVLVATSLALLFTIRPSGIPVFILHLFAWGGLEWKLYTKDRAATDYRYLKFLVATFTVAFAVWILDITRVWCDPSNHWVQGHALWHILTSLVVWYFYLFHTQFRALPTGRPQGPA